MRQQPQHPFEGKGAFGDDIDIGERLEGERLEGERVLAVGPRRSKIEITSAHAECGGTGRPAFVEDRDLGVGIAAELQSDQRQQNRLARAGRANDDRVPDITDMGDEPEGRRPVGTNGQERWAVEMCVSVRPAQLAESGIMWARLSVLTGAARTLA